MINVIVAEPNQMVRLGIRSVLEKQPDFSIVDEVADADGLRAIFLEVEHDVVLVELGLLKRLGSTVLRDLRQARPDSRILVHSYEIDTDFGAEAFRFGAIGYFANDCSTADLCAAVSRVAAGQPYVTHLLGEELAMAACFRASNLPRAMLNAREQRVFKMLAIGLDTRQIARQMGTSIAAVQTCRTRIMAKMQLPDACALVRHAISQSVRRGYAH